MTTLSGTGEFALISRVTATLPTSPAVIVGPGDDAAVLAGQGSLVCSTDAMVEGIHFRRDWSSAHDVGRKLVAENVADVEAMGATPTAVVVAFSAPGDLPVAWAEEFMAGVVEECERAGAALVGGDTTSARDITVCATALGSLGERPAVLRSGAQPGDVVALAGRTGWAAAGLVVLQRGFRSPRAVVAAQRVPEVPYGQGRRAAESGAHAMIDVSDGLIADLGHIADLSGVTIDLDASAFEIPDPIRAVGAATGTDPLALILTGGEDHALAGTFAPDAVPEGWRVVGSVRAGEPQVFVDGATWEGRGGWQHFE